MGALEALLALSGCVSESTAPAMRLLHARGPCNHMIDVISWCKFAAFLPKTLRLCWHGGYLPLLLLGEGAEHAEAAGRETSRKKLAADLHSRPQNISRASGRCAETTSQHS